MVSESARGDSVDSLVDSDDCASGLNEPSHRTFSLVRVHACRLQLASGCSLHRSYPTTLGLALRTSVHFRFDNDILKSSSRSSTAISSSSLDLAAPISACR